MDRFKVYYNAHIYNDISDKPKSKSCIIKAESAEEAVEIMQERRRKQWDSFIASNGKPQFYGMIHSAEKIGV